MQYQFRLRQLSQKDLLERLKIKMEFRVCGLREVLMLKYQMKKLNRMNPEMLEQQKLASRVHGRLLTEQFQFQQFQILGQHLEVAVDVGRQRRVARAEGLEAVAALELSAAAPRARLLHTGDQRADGEDGDQRLGDAGAGLPLRLQPLAGVRQQLLELVDALL